MELRFEIIALCLHSPAIVHTKFTLSFPLNIKWMFQELIGCIAGTDRTLERGANHIKLHDFS